MDINTLRVALEPFINLFGAVVVSGATTAIATEILKLKAIPLPAQRYPRLTAGIVSVIASLVAVYLTTVNILIDSLFGLVAFIVGTLIVSAITYNNLIKGAPVQTQVDAGNANPRSTRR